MSRKGNAQRSMILLDLDATWKSFMNSAFELGMFVTNVQNKQYYSASMGVCSFLLRRQQHQSAAYVGRASQARLRKLSVA